MPLLSLRRIEATLWITLSVSQYVCKSRFCYILKSLSLSLEISLFLYLSLLISISQWTLFASCLSHLFTNKLFRLASICPIGIIYIRFYCFKISINQQSFRKFIFNYQRECTHRKTTECSGSCLATSVVKILQVNILIK